MNPDELYALIVKAIIDSPQLLIVKGDEAGRHLHFSMFDHKRNWNYYFELANYHDDKEPCIGFTTSSLENQEQLAKAACHELFLLFSRF